MDIVIQPEAEAAARLVARLVAQAVRVKPHLLLGLATGRSLVPVYRLLVDLHRREGLDFSLCRTFNLDEFVGLPAEHPSSSRQTMNEALFRHVNLDSRNTHLPDGTASDLTAECRRYDDLVQELGGIDLQLLGIGAAGQIGLNEPLSALRSRTRVKALTPTTVARNAERFGGPEQVPRRAITMGVGTILGCRRCLLLATGAEKAEIVAKATEGLITSLISATALQLHPKCTVVVDEAAASRLRGSEHYRWMFENEPEWAEFR